MPRGLQTWNATERIEDTISSASKSNWSGEADAAVRAGDWRIDWKDVEKTSSLMELRLSRARAERPVGGRGKEITMGR